MFTNIIVLHFVESTFVSKYTSMITIALCTFLMGSVLRKKFSDRLFFFFINNAAVKLFCLYFVESTFVCEYTKISAVIAKVPKINKLTTVQCTV